LTILFAALFLSTLSSIDVSAAVKSFLADLPADIREALAQLEGTAVTELDPQAQLDAIFQAGTPHGFDAGVLVAYTDCRWFSTSSSGGRGAPLLELRRWPGDTALALYALGGPFVAERPGGPPFAAAETAMQPPSEAGLAEWRGLLETDAGKRRFIWIEIDIPGEGPSLGALLLPGDAGLGAAGEEDLIIELRVVLGRVRIDPERWDKLQGIEPGINLVIPAMGGTPGDKDESEAPWQVARGSGFTIGLPPGFRAWRMDGAVPPPQNLTGGLLWFRGRFKDTEGTAIAVGDELRAGYIADINPVRKTWSKSEEPPLGAPRATLAAKQPFAMVAERVRATSATAERWKEPDFSGEWLVFRLIFEERGMEIALPVLEGRRSPSLFWIPATWRSSDRLPAPPPVDPAERFGIRFERLRPSEQSRLPWVEGYLEVPGLRLEVPTGWFPSASLRSHDGYPIRFFDGDGITRGMLNRLSPDEWQAVGELEPQWKEKKKIGMHRAEHVYATEEGSYLLIAKQGHAFLVEPREMTSPDARELWQLLVQSIQLQK
jgi:hypothetical protein